MSQPRRAARPPADNRKAPARPADHESSTRLRAAPPFAPAPPALGERLELTVENLERENVAIKTEIHELRRTAPATVAPPNLASYLAELRWAALNGEEDSLAMAVLYLQVNEPETLDAIVGDHGFALEQLAKAAASEARGMLGALDESSDMIVLRAQTLERLGALLATGAQLLREAAEGRGGEGRGDHRAHP